MVSRAGRIVGAIKKTKNIKSLSKVLRSNTYFRNIYDRSKLKSILDFDDVVDILDREKKSKEFIFDKLFTVSQSNRFIFEDEGELKQFIFMRDKTAKICKVMELEEVTIYMVEGSIFTEERSMLLNYVASSVLYMAFRQFYNNVILFINSFYNLYLNLLTEIFNEINTKLSEEKQNDIDNTYCIDCDCTCSCSCDCGGDDGGSCSCSCSCDCSCTLVHYTQSWENLRAYIDEKEEYLKEQLYLKTVNNGEGSLLFLFMGAYQTLQYILKTQIREKYLFIVLKKDNIFNIYKNKIKQKQKKVSRVIYEYVLHHINKKLEYSKFIDNLNKYVNTEMGRKYSKHQIRVLLNTVLKRYNIKKESIKINNKRYIYLLKSKK